MAIDYQQLNKIWTAYITNKVTTSPEPVNKQLIDFLLNATIDFMDYEDFEYGEYGDIGIRYLDFLYGEEEVEVRRIESLDESFEPTWGFMHKNRKNDFDNWLKKRFGLCDNETRVTLEWVHTFLYAVLKKEPHPS